MKECRVIPQKTFKYELEVMEKGHLEFDVPFLPGSRVTVFVIEHPTYPVDPLLEAAQSTLDFWDNPFDDEDWNNV